MSACPRNIWTSCRSADDSSSRLANSRRRSCTWEDAVLGAHGHTPIRRRGKLTPESRAAFQAVDPHTVADDHGDPEELLAKLDAAEAETAALRDKLKTILAEALAR